MGGIGRSLIYAGPNGDTIYASEGGSIIHAGGGADQIWGGSGDDVIEVGRGSARIDGGGGTNLVVFHGAHGEYKVRVVGGAYEVSDMVSGRDGVVSLTNIEKLSFLGLSSIILGGLNVMPVSDVLSKDHTGEDLKSGSVMVLSAADIVINDQMLGGDGELSISSVEDAVGGKVSLNQYGDVLFEPAPGFTGMHSFKYTPVIAGNSSSLVVTDLSSGLTAPMRGVVTLRTEHSPIDPLASEQWYLTDVNVLPVWREFSGKGVRIGLFEPAGEFATSPEVFDIYHPDLNRNVDPGWFVSERDAGSLPQSYSRHATLVAGVMAASRNDIGGIGIAYDAKLAGHNLGVQNFDLSSLGKMVRYDIVNNSWGFSRGFALSNLQGGLINDVSAAISSAQYAAANGRGGLGTVMVSGAGNARRLGGSSQESFTSSSRLGIQVAAINAQSDLSTLYVGSKPFSNPGSSLLVAAPGSKIVSTSRKLVTERGSIFGADYATIQGTSFSAPIVSGVVALMLEANPNLGYRDVQQILALSASRVDGGGIEWGVNGASNWNGGGMLKNDDYGFGKVDALAAVRMAESWVKQSTYANEVVFSTPLISISEDLNAGQTLSRAVGFQSGLNVEHVEVDFEADLGRLSDLTLMLTSPKGTTSTLIRDYAISAGREVDEVDLGNPQRHGAFKYSFMSTQHWGEDSSGAWTLSVANSSGGKPMTVKNWAVRVFGDASPVKEYFFTNEFEALAKSDASRLAVSEEGTDGRKVFNSAAITSDVEVNAHSSEVYINEVKIPIFGAAAFQTLVTGDGDDSLIAGGLNTLLDGGRGSNYLMGGGGKDLFVVRRKLEGVDTIASFDAGGNDVIRLVGFGDMSFGDLPLKDVNGSAVVELPTGQSLVVFNVPSSKIRPRHFYFEDYFSVPTEEFYSGKEELLIDMENPERVIMRGGGAGVSFVSNGGPSVADLAGTVYGRSSVDSHIYVIARQAGKQDYLNALRGFRQGIDKIDVSNLGITGIEGLVIEKENRITVNGLALVQGVSIVVKDDTRRSKIKLAYLDAIDTSQLNEADFVFSAAGTDSLVFKSLFDPVPGESSLSLPDLFGSEERFKKFKNRLDQELLEVSPIEVGPVVQDSKPHATHGLASSSLGSFIESMSAFAPLEAVAAMNTPHHVLDMPNMLAVNAL